MNRSILHVIRSMNPELGGPVEVVRQIARVHREMGCNVEVASLDVPEDSWIKDSTGTIHALGEETSRNGAGYGWSAKAVPWLRENRRRFDAVFSHGLWQYNNVAVREAMLGTATPWFVYPHGMLDPWFKRAYPLKHLKKTIYWLLRERAVLRDATAVLFTCEEERRLAAGTFPLYRCREWVAPLGISRPPIEDGEGQKRFFFERFPELAGKRILLFLGRLHDKKGCDLLIDAFGKTAAGNGGPWHLLMAGPCADDAYRAHLQEMAGAHCPPGTVSFPGMFTGDLKWGAFHAAEAFILPSHQENFGIAVAEALACGVPVLISDKVNIWREIAADRAGFVERDDPPGTRALIEQWMRLDESGRAAMREAAGKCFGEKFRIEQTARELLALIERFGEKREAPDAAPSTS